MDWKIIHGSTILISANSLFIWARTIKILSPVYIKNQIDTTAYILLEDEGHN